MMQKVGPIALAASLLAGAAWAQDERPAFRDLDAAIARERSAVIGRLRQSSGPSLRDGQFNPGALRVDRSNALTREGLNTFVQRATGLVDPQDFSQQLRLRAPVAARARQVVTSVIQFQVPPTPQQRAELEQQGLTIEEFVGGTSYVVSVDTQRGDAGQALEAAQVGVEAAGLLPADQKLKAAATVAAALPVPVGGRSFFVRSGAGLGLADMQSEIGPAGTVQQVGPGLFRVQAGAGELGRIAAIESVLSIDAGPPPFLPLNARSLIGADRVQAFSLHDGDPSYAGPIGRGVKVAVFDDAIDEKHPDFSNGSGTNFFFFKQDSAALHGTHVASIIGGSGRMSDADGFPAYENRGIAPGVLLGEFPLVLGREVDVTLLSPALRRHESDLSNHSYVETLYGYGAMSALIDGAIHGSAVMTGPEGSEPALLPPRPQIWAAGNNGVPHDLSEYGTRFGYYSVFTQAKNSISVGSVDVETGRLSRFSSLGPTFDGRIKPDLVAPGCVESGSSVGPYAALSGTQGYTSDLCGTSQAAPHVSGIVAMMMEKTGSRELLPSTYKALLIQTAQDQILLDADQSPVEANPDTGKPLVYHAGPDFATGFGLVDAKAAVDLAADAGRWREGDVAGEGETRTYCVSVPEGLPQIKATLAWDDPPGATTERPINLPVLVNDLSLELIAPDGTRIHPWTLPPPPGPTVPQSPDSDPIGPDQIVPAARGIDNLNTVEMASVEGPAPGQWKVVVSAASLDGGAAQRFSLAANRPLETPCN